LWGSVYSWVWDQNSMCWSSLPVTTHHLRVAVGFLAFCPIPARELWWATMPERCVSLTSTAPLPNSNNFPFHGNKTSSPFALWNGLTWDIKLRRSPLDIYLVIGIRPEYSMYIQVQLVKQASLCPCICCMHVVFVQNSEESSS